MSASVRCGDAAGATGSESGWGERSNGIGDEVKVAARSALKAAAISSSSSSYVFDFDGEDVGGGSSIAGGRAAGMLSLGTTCCSLGDRSTLTLVDTGGCKGWEC